MPAASNRAAERLSAPRGSTRTQITQTQPPAVIMAPTKGTGMATLPQELRDLIWEQAMDLPTTAGCTGPLDDSHLGITFRRVPFMSLRPPLISRICRDSRGFALRYYGLDPNSTTPPTPPTPPTPCRFDYKSAFPYIGTSAVAGRTDWDEWCPSLLSEEPRIIIDGRMLIDSKVRDLLMVHLIMPAADGQIMVNWDGEDFIALINPERLISEPLAPATAFWRDQPPHYVDVRDMLLFQEIATIFTSSHGTGPDQEPASRVPTLVREVVMTHGAPFRGVNGVSLPLNILDSIRCRINLRRESEGQGPLKALPEVRVAVRISVRFFVDSDNMASIEQEVSPWDE